MNNLAAVLEEGRTALPPFIDFLPMADASGAFRADIVCTVCNETLPCVTARFAREQVFDYQTVTELKGEFRRRAIILGHAFSKLHQTLHEAAK